MSPKQNHRGQFEEWAKIRINEQMLAINLRWLWLVVSIFYLFPAFGQGLTDVDAGPLNLARLQHQKTAMLTLGGWAVGNIAIGAALRGSRTGPDRYFHDMNAYWNIVNLGIASIGYFTALREAPESYTLFQSISKHYSFQKVLLFNAGLDVGYMLGGLYLQERARRGGENADRLKGFGQSILLQGGFLFAFDVVNYFISAKLDQRFDTLLSFQGNGISLTWQF